MKLKIILFSLAAYFLLGVGKVSAGSESLLLWSNVDRQFMDSLIVAMKSRPGWFDEQKGIAINGLAWNAYQVAMQEDLLLLVKPEDRSEERYAELFRQTNNLTGDYLPIREFVSIANERGFFFPAASEQELKFAQLQARMDQLETAAKTGDEQAKAELADFKSRLEQYGLKLDKLAGLQSAVRQLEETQVEHGQRLSRLSTKVDGQGDQIGKLQDFDRELSMQVAILESRLTSQQAELNQLRKSQLEGFSQLESDVDLLKTSPGYNLVQSLGGVELAEAYDDWFNYIVMAMALLIILGIMFFTVFSGNRPKPDQQATADQPKSDEKVTKMSNHRRRAEKSRRRQAA